MNHIFQKELIKTAKYFKNTLNLFQMKVIFRKPFAFMKTLDRFLFVKENTLDNQCFSFWDKHYTNKFLFFLLYTRTFFYILEFSKEKSPLETLDESTASAWLKLLDYWLHHFTESFTSPVHLQKHIYTSIKQSQAFKLFHFHCRCHNPLYVGSRTTFISVV